MSEGYGLANRYLSVVSSNISKILYQEQDGSDYLYVTFLNGSEYVYFDVPYEVFVEFYRSGSKGRFLHQRIKGVYQYQKV